VRVIIDHKELTRLLEGGRGYILNDRPDRKLLHHVSCQSLEAMVPGAYRKLFFEEADEAEKLLDQEFGPNNWANCGSCGGKHRQNSR